MKRIITVTPNPAVDSATSIDQVVIERKLRCSAPVRYPGGGGLNVTRAIKELGGASCAIWTRGGPLGELLESLLEEAAVEHVAVAIERQTRENVLVFDKSAEGFYRFGMPGPELSAEECRRLVDALRDAERPPDYVVASGSLPDGEARDVYVDLARVCHERGWRLVLDTHSRELQRVLGVAPVYLIKPNYREFLELAGADDLEDDQIVSEARRLVDDGSVEVVVVSLGPAGALLVDAHRHEHVPAPTVPVVSRIGAGDSMVAGVVLQLARDADLLDAVRFGIASSAAAVMTPGTELCRREDAERLYRSMVEAAGGARSPGGEHSP